VYGTGPVDFALSDNVDFPQLVIWEVSGNREVCKTDYTDFMLENQKMNVRQFTYLSWDYGGADLSSLFPGLSCILLILFLGPVLAKFIGHMFRQPPSWVEQFSFPFFLFFVFPFYFLTIWLFNILGDYKEFPGIPFLIEFCGALLLPLLFSILLALLDN